MMHRNWKKQGEALLREIRETKPRQGESALWALGQMGFVVKTAEMLCYIDVVLTDFLDAEGNSRKWFPAPFEPELLDADYFFCTHNHKDHLNPETIQRAASGCQRTVFIVPAPHVKQLEELGIDKSRIRGARAGEILELEGVRVYPVSAAHPEHTNDENGDALSLSYGLESGGTFILHTGDSYLTQQLLTDYQKLPHPDVLLLPVNGCDYFRTARGCIGNFNPIEAARLAILLHAGLTIPAHFDMIKGNTCDPLLFARQLWEEDSSACWKIPALGERVFVIK